MFVGLGEMKEDSGKEEKKHEIVYKAKCINIWEGKDGICLERGKR